MKRSGIWAGLHNLVAVAGGSRAGVQAARQASPKTVDQPQRVRCTAAYTLLELILALALLGALMAVAWSLMGTFRDAEMRGWKLAHRTQTIRAARQWLQNDMQHLLQPALLTASTGASQVQLNGNTLGFTASISPSIDPIPFLEQLLTNPLANTTANAEELSAANLFTDTAVASQAYGALWPDETLNVEYQLIPQEASATTAPASVMRSGAATDTLFTLIRRELMDVSSIENIRNPSSNASQANSDSERVLTAQDLYRQTDDTRPSRGVALRETRLDGLVRGQFQYFDGASWRAEWNSEQSGGLPRAIALGFDFPARVDMQPRQASATTMDIDNASGADEAGGGISSLTTGSMQSFAESALAAEPTITSSSSGGDSSLMQNATHEVQIVVYVGGQASGSVDQQPFDSRTGGDF